MNETVAQYSEQTQDLAEQRAEQGILLLTSGGRILMIDSRAAALCQQMRVAAGDPPGVLPLSLVTIVHEIAASLETRTHLKDWEAFRLTRVIQAPQGHILVTGIGLPAKARASQRRILLTLDAVIPRTGSRRLDAFRLTPREVATVEGLLKGSTNKEIAQAMGISEQTAKEHMKHIMEKTTTTTRTGVLMAIAGPREMVDSATSLVGQGQQTI